LETIMASYATTTGALTRAPIKPNFILANRADIEAEIERLIAFLDACDGDPDLEPETDMGGDDLDAGESVYRIIPVYGLDQTIAPINLRQMCRAHHLDTMEGRA
jgi:hypothetical protein